MYIIFYFLSFFFLPFDRLDNRGKKFALVFVVAIIFTLIAGLRVGVKPDWYNYSWVFENFKESRMFDYSAYSKEPGYMLLNYIVREVFNSRFFLFTLIAFFSISFTFISYFRMTNYPFLCIMIYTSFFFINRDMGAIRASLAYSMFLFSLTLPKRKYYLLNLLAFSIHFTAILAFLVPFLVRIFTTKKRLVLVLFFSAVFHFSGISGYILELLSHFGGAIVSSKANAYMGSDDLTYNIQFFDITNMKNLAFSGAFLLFYDRLKNEKFFTVVLCVYIFGTAFRIAFSDLGVIAGRGYAIFNTVEPVIISYGLLVSNKFKYRILFYVFIFLYGLASVNMTVYKYQTFPYENYINSIN